MKTSYRRNEIVHTASFREGSEPEFYMFGRIVKKIDDSHYLVVSNGKNFEILPTSHLKPAIGSDGKPYTGYWTTAASLFPDWKFEKYGPHYDYDTDKYTVRSMFPQHKVFVPIPKLRTLKQNASWYHLVWRKQKKTRWETLREQCTDLD